MSYDIYLTDPVTGETLHLPEKHQLTGGTYCIGGTTECHLNITYNYAKHYYPLFPKRSVNPELDDQFYPDDDNMVGGVRYIYGLSGAESIPILDLVIDQLGNDVDDDYWKPTEGNAKQALLKLRALAYLRPDGVWKGD